MCIVKHFIEIAFAASAFLLCGCANIRVTNPSRTATEQFLLSQAATEAIEGFSFEPLFGRKVYLDSSRFASTDNEFVLGEFRAALLQAGVQFPTDANDAEIIVEIRSGGVGIDRYESLTGLPALTAPAASSVAGPEALAASSVITPEIAITKNIKQISFASIAYVAYWRQTGEVVTSEGPSTGRAYREDWWFLGIGPKTISNIITRDNKIQ